MHAEPPLPPGRVRRRVDPLFVAITIGHFVMYPVVVGTAYVYSMRNFDGGPAHPAAPVLWGAAKVMSLPLVLPVHLAGVTVRGPA